MKRCFVYDNHSIKCCTNDNDYYYLYGNNSADLFCFLNSTGTIKLTNQLTYFVTNTEANLKTNLISVLEYRNRISLDQPYCMKHLLSKSILQNSFSSRVKITKCHWSVSNLVSLQDGSLQIISEEENCTVTLSTNGLIITVSYPCAVYHNLNTDKYITISDEIWEYIWMGQQFTIYQYPIETWYIPVTILKYIWHQRNYPNTMDSLLEAQYIQLQQQLELTVLFPTSHEPYLQVDSREKFGMVFENDNLLDQSIMAKTTLNEFDSILKAKHSSSISSFVIKEITPSVEYHLIFFDEAKTLMGFCVTLKEENVYIISSPFDYELNKFIFIKWVDATEDFRAIEKTYSLESIPEKIFTFSANGKKEKEYPAKLILQNALQFFQNAKEIYEKYKQQQHQVGILQQRTQSSYSNEVKQSIQLEHWGEFFQYEDGRIKVFFKDRTILELNRDATFCKMVGRDAEIYQIYFANQISEAMQKVIEKFKQYLEQAFEFRNWVNKSEEEKQNDIEDVKLSQQILRDIIIEREIQLELLHGTPNTLMEKNEDVEPVAPLAAEVKLLSQRAERAKKELLELLL